MPPPGAVALRRALDRLPRARLADPPTPLHDCPRLSAALGGPRILIKRDDLTGLAFGGNKTRVVEFILGDALAHGADAIVARGASQSNHRRQDAAACVRLGLEAHLVIESGRHNDLQGNLLLDYLFGAHVHLVQGDSLAAFDPSNVADQADQVVADLRRQGRHPYLISIISRRVARGSSSTRCTRARPWRGWWAWPGARC